MKLYYANTSPYARKVRITLRELDLLDRVEEIFQNPFEESPDLLAANPLKKVPCLVTGAGEAIFDSPVICAYLASLASRPALQADGAARWRVRTGEALADGILDAAFAIVMEGRRPEAQRSESWMERWRAGIARAIGAVDSATFPLGPEVNAAQIALGAALGYLDFRLPELDWRAGHGELERWYAGFAARPAMQQTQPPAS